ncbi:MAG: ATP-dependent Clp protease proteolytic subunit [Gemmatimonadetes bacterium]|nr:ATP-dependent Clp protease proteolytic subunit [Gemmatimonadota bacterium]
MPRIASEIEEFARTLADNEMRRQFLEARKIFLWGAVTDESSEKLVKELMYLTEADAKKEITFYINSPGGVISAGLAVYDAIQMIEAPVRTICTGQAASMGAVLLTCGAPGLRGAWEHARIMIHQPLISGRMYAPTSDLEIQAEEMLRVRGELNEILSRHTGAKVEQIEKDTDRDNFMTSEEAKGYGLLDYVVGRES